MSDKFVPVLRHAMESSAVVGVGRCVAEGSVVCAGATVVCAGATAVTRWLRLTRKRIIVGLGGEWSAEREIRSTHQLLVFADKSRFVARLSSQLNAPFAAWQGSGLRRVLDAMIRLDLPTQVVRLGGWVVVTTVVTNVALLSVLGVRVELVGWTVRAGLVAAGLAVMWRPRALASAWKDRAIKRG